MPTIPVNFTGGSYEHRSRALSAQVTRNFYPQLQEIGNEKSPYILEPFYGKTLFSSAAGSGISRGHTVYKDNLYHVCGTTLYKVTSDGVHESIGVILGTAYCIFADAGEFLVITSGGVVYLYDGTDLTVNTDTDLESPNSCAYINSQVAYDGEGARFCVADAGAPGTINGLNYATAEYKPDDIVRVYAWGNELLPIVQKDHGAVAKQRRGQSAV
jgi:hypothetical protein